MKFHIAYKVDTPASAKNPMMTELCLALKEYFKEKDYGSDVEDYSLMIICMNSHFGQNHPVNKPHYVAHRVSKNRFTGMPHTMHKLFLNEVKFETAEYGEFLKANEADAKKMLAKKVLDSLSNLDHLPKKIKDFDKVRFKKDMEEYLKQNYLGQFL